MMAIAGALVGAVWGGVLAKRRNDNSLDILRMLQDTPSFVA